MRKILHLFAFGLVIGLPVALLGVSGDDHDPSDTERSAEESTVTAPFISEVDTIRVHTPTKVFPGGVGGISSGPSGILYVADFRERVYRVDVGGEVSVFARGLRGPSGNVVGPDGELYQSAIKGGTVHRIHDDGTTTVVAQDLAAPVGLLLEPDGSLLIANCDANLLARAAPDGALAIFAKDPLFRCPNGLARGPDGGAYVSNFSDGRILRVSERGQVEIYATTPGSGNGHLAWLGQTLFVAGFSTHQIFAIDAQGQVMVVAGDGIAGSRDGSGRSARFVHPNGLALSAADGCLYTNDSLRHLAGGGDDGKPSTTVVRAICGLGKSRGDGPS